MTGTDFLDGLAGILCDLKAPRNSERIDPKDGPFCSSKARCNGGDSLVVQPIRAGDATSPPLASRSGRVSQQTLPLASKKDKGTHHMDPLLVEFAVGQFLSTAKGVVLRKLRRGPDFELENADGSRVLIEVKGGTPRRDMLQQLAKQVCEYGKPVDRFLLVTPTSPSPTLLSEFELTFAREDIPKRNGSRSVTSLANSTCPHQETSPLQEHYPRKSA